MHLNVRHLLLFIFALATFQIVLAQKAYEAVYYRGEVHHLSVRFTLADGYLAGCDLSTKDLHTRKKGIFVPTSGVPGAECQLRFDHFSKTGQVFKDSFVVHGISEAYKVLPQSLSANYYLNGKAYRFQLRQY